MKKIRRAFLTLHQEAHQFAQENQKRRAPKVYAIYPLDLAPGNLWVIGRQPERYVDQGLAIVIPNPAVTAYLASIKSLKTDLENLHLLELQSEKLGQKLINEYSGSPVTRCVLRNGDVFSINKLPIRLVYNLKEVNIDSDVFETWT